MPNDIFAVGKGGVELKRGELMHDMLMIMMMMMMMISDLCVPLAEMTSPPSPTPPPRGRSES